jgi:hypothetical protein
LVFRGRLTEPGDSAITTVSKLALVVLEVRPSYAGSIRT